LGNVSFYEEHRTTCKYVQRVRSDTGEKICYRPMTNLSTRIPPVTEAVAVTNDHLREDATLKNKCETISESYYHNVINLSEHYTFLV